MIDAKKQVVAALQQTGLKVHYEHFVNSQTALPCITYTEYDNSALMDGDTLGYSTIIFHVKVWGKDIKTLTEYAEQIDTIMRGMGFKRRNCFDLWLDGIGQRQLKYEAKALENYKETI